MGKNDKKGDPMFHSRNRSEQSTARRGRRMPPSPAFVVSMIALLIALSGTALALPGQNTVNSGDIVDNSVKSIDLKDGAAVQTEDVVDQTLTGADIADDSLQAEDLAPNSVTSSELADSSVNSAKIADNSVNGDDLASVQSNSNFVLVAGGAAENGAYVTDEVTATCPAGTQLISGSGYWYNQQSGEELFISGVRENYANQSVTVAGGNDSGQNRYLGAVAHCI
jgi:trimeric autotransporter adhesin